MISRPLFISLFGTALTIAASFFAAGTVLADAAPPASETLVHFMQNGKLVTGPVDFTLTCLVRADADPRSSRFVTVSFPGRCSSADCRVDTSMATEYLTNSAELVKDCSVKGTVAGMPFQVEHALVQKPDSLSCDANYNMLVGDASGMNYYVYTPAYNNCMTSVRQKYYSDSSSGFTCNAYRKLVKTCSPTGRCLMIDNKTYEETPASEACIQREIDEEHACLALATNVTSKLHRSANGEAYETACQAVINLPATTNTTMTASTTMTAMPVDATTTLRATSDTNDMNVVSMPAVTASVQRSFFGRLLDGIRCFFVHVFGGICVGEAR